jgi:hypothetical protein
MDMSFDRDRGDFWAVCDNTCHGRTEQWTIDPTTGHFRIAHLFERPANMPDINNEGFTVASELECHSGLKPAFWSDDDNDGGVALRGGTAPCNDITPPVVTVTGVANGATYTQGYNLPVAGCNTTDADSGVGVFATLSLSSQVPGPVTATCSGGKDKAGNAAAPVSVTYTVQSPAQGLQAAITQALGTGPEANAFQSQADSISSAPNANAKDGKLGAFTNHVNAQTGKALTPDQAAEFIALAKLL